MSAYRVLNFDLSVVRSKELVTQTRNNEVATVNVVQLPNGAAVSIAFGSGGEDIPLLAQGAEFELCPAEKEGLFITNPAGAGTLVLMVSFAEATVQVQSV